MPNENLDEVPALAVLLGSKVKTWPYSEDTLVEALRLRSQQEQTKRQYYKLENVNKSLELLREAANAGIPASSIAQLFNNDGVDKAGVDTNEPTSHRKTNHTKEPTPVSVLPERQPKNYRFPPEKPSIASVPLNDVRIHKRTHSPARIGADAVATLNHNMSLKEESGSNESEQTSMSSSVQSNTHKRMQSMPVLSNEPTTGVLNFAPWQTYNGQNLSQNSISSVRKSQLSGTSSFPPSVRKHRRTHSSNSAFGVIDLNAVTQASFKHSHSRNGSYQNNSLNNHRERIAVHLDKSKDKAEVVSEPSSADADVNDDTYSELSSNDTTMEQIKKTPSTSKIIPRGPNYVDNLLNT